LQTWVACKKIFENLVKVKLSLWLMILKLCLYIDDNIVVFDGSTGSNSEIRMWIVTNGFYTVS